MVMVPRAAYDATKETCFLGLQRLAFNCFLGANELSVALYDLRTKGCSDGLMSSGVNGSQGPESMVGFLLSLLSITEIHALSDSTERQAGEPR